MPRVNEAIRASNLRVISESGKQLGILSRAEALERARNLEMDLVEVSSDTNPPVVKIINWGKYNYQRTKQLQKNKRNAKTADLKQMRVGLKIGPHDLEVKMRKVREFLDSGHKVKITVIYRGRELAHKEVGFKLAERIISDFGDTILVDQPPQFAGRQINLVVRSNNAKAKKP